MSTGIYANRLNEVGFETALSRAAMKLSKTEKDRSNTLNFETLLKIPYLSFEPILRSIISGSSIRDEFLMRYQELLATLKVSLYGDDPDNVSADQVKYYAVIEDSIMDLWAHFQTNSNLRGPFDYMVLRLFIDKNVSTSKKVGKTEVTPINSLWYWIMEGFSRCIVLYDRAAVSDSNSLSTVLGKIRHEVNTNSDNVNLIATNLSKEFGPDIGDIKLIQGLVDRCHEAYSAYSDLRRKFTELRMDPKFKKHIAQTTDNYSISISATSFYNNFKSFLSQFESSIDSQQKLSAAQFSVGADNIISEPPSSKSGNVQGITFLAEIDFDDKNWKGEYHVADVVGSDVSDSRIIESTDKNLDAVCVCGKCGQSYAVTKGLVQVDASLYHTHVGKANDTIDSKMEQVRARHVINSYVCPHCKNINIIPETLINAIRSYLLSIYEIHTSTETTKANDKIEGIWTDPSNEIYISALDNIMSEVTTSGDINLNDFGVDSMFGIDAVKGMIIELLSKDNSVDDCIKSFKVEDDYRSIYVPSTKLDVFKKHVFETEKYAGADIMSQSDTRLLAKEMIFNSSNDYNAMIDTEFLPRIRIGDSVSQKIAFSGNVELGTLTKSLLQDQDKYRSRFDFENSRMTANSVQEFINSKEIAEPDISDKEYASEATGSGEQATSSPDKRAGSQIEEFQLFKMKPTATGLRLVDKRSNLASDHGIDSRYPDGRLSGMRYPHNMSIFNGGAPDTYYLSRVPESNMVESASRIYLDKLVSDGYGNIRLKPSVFTLEFLDFMRECHTDLGSSLHEFLLGFLSYKEDSDLLLAKQCNELEGLIRKFIVLKDASSTLRGCYTSESIEEYVKILDGLNLRYVYEGCVADTPEGKVWDMPNVDRTLFTLSPTSCMDFSYDVTLKVVDLIKEHTGMSSDEIKRIIFSSDDELDKFVISASRLQVIGKTMVKWYGEAATTLSDLSDRYVELSSINLIPDDVLMEVLNKFYDEFIRMLRAHVSPSKYTDEIQFISRRSILDFLSGYCNQRYGDLDAFARNLCNNRYGISAKCFDATFISIVEQTKQSNSQMSSVMKDICKHIRNSFKSQGLLEKEFNLPMLINESRLDGVITDLHRQMNSIVNDLYTKFSDDLSFDIVGTSKAKSNASDMLGRPMYIKDKYTDTVLNCALLVENMLIPVLDEYYEDAILNTLNAADFNGTCGYDILYKFTTKSEDTIESVMRYSTGKPQGYTYCKDPSSELKRIDSIIRHSDMPDISKRIYFVIRNHYVNLMNTCGITLNLEGLINQSHNCREAIRYDRVQKISNKGSLSPEVTKFINDNILDARWVSEAELESVVKPNGEYLAVMLQDKPIRDLVDSYADKTDLYAVMQRVQLKAMAGIFIAALNCSTVKDCATKIGFDYSIESDFESHDRDILTDIFGIQIDSIVRQELAAFIDRYADVAMLFDCEDLRQEIYSQSEVGEDEALNIDESIGELKDRYPSFRDSRIKDIAFMILNKYAPCDRASLFELLTEFRSLRDVIQYNYIERFSMLLLELQSF